MSTKCKGKGGYLEVCFYICETCQIFHIFAKRFITHYTWAHDIEFSIAWKLFFNSIFIDFMTFFYELTWFSTATCGLCSVTSKVWCWDNGVSLRVKALSVRQPENDTRPCENALSRISSDMLHQCSTFVSPETRMWSLPTCLHFQLNSLVMCFKSTISGHVFLPRIQRHTFIGWTCYYVASFCNEMLLYIVKDWTVCNWNLCGYYPTNNCPSGEKKIITL